MLTPTMIKAIQCIRKNGKLVRYKGGFWQKENDPCEGKSGTIVFPLDWIATKTINALIAKKIFVVVKEKSYPNITYPIEVMLTEFGEVVLNSKQLNHDR